MSRSNVDLRRAKAPSSRFPKAWYVRAERGEDVIAFFCIRPQDALSDARRLREENLGRVWIEDVDGGLATDAMVEKVIWRRA